MDVAVENSKNGECVDTVKVLLANRPRMLRELLRDLIQRQADMEVVGEMLDPVELLLAVGETHADVVVVGLPDSDDEPGICSHLLAEYPHLLILALSPERDRAFLYRLGICKEQLSKASDEEILAAIRQAEVDNISRQ